MSNLNKSFFLFSVWIKRGGSTRTLVEQRRFIFTSWLFCFSIGTQLNYFWKNYEEDRVLLLLPDQASLFHDRLSRAHDSFMQISESYSLISNWALEHFMPPSLKWPEWLLKVTVMIIPWLNSMQNSGNWLPLLHERVEAKSVRLLIQGSVPGLHTCRGSWKRPYTGKHKSRSWFLGEINL